MLNDKNSLVGIIIHNTKNRQIRQEFEIKYNLYWMALIFIVYKVYF